MTSIEGSYVSADGHVVEPAELWTTRMDKRFRDRAPRVESRPENDYYIVDGHPPMPVGLEHRWVEPKLDEMPSAYFQRQFWATFEDDRAGILTRDLMGVDRLLWGADYPHTEGVWPRSREQIAKDFVGVPEADVHKMLVDNAARLYNIA